MSHFLTPLLTRRGSPCALVNARSGATLATRLEPAFDSQSRRRGLLGRDGLEEGAALIIAPCSGIHTFFMRFPIDVLFVRKDGRVLKVSHAVPAWRLRFSPRAFAVVELPAGVLARTDTRDGDIVTVAPAPPVPAAGDRPA